MRLEKLIRSNTTSLGLNGSEFLIKVLSDENNELKISVRPYNIDGEPNIYIVKDNILYPV